MRCKSTAEKMGEPEQITHAGRGHHSRHLWVAHFQGAVPRGSCGLLHSLAVPSSAVTRVACVSVHAAPGAPRVVWEISSVGLTQLSFG